MVGKPELLVYFCPMCRTAVYIAENEFGGEACGNCHRTVLEVAPCGRHRWWLRRPTGARVIISEAERDFRAGGG